MKKFDLNFLVFCDHAVQDNKGKVSLIGIFENFNVQKFPATLISFVVAGNTTVIDTDIKEATIDLEAFDNKIKSILPSKLTLTVNSISPIPGGGPRKINFLFTINGLTFVEKGNYKFKVTINNEEVGELDLDVRTLN